MHSRSFYAKRSVRVDLRYNKYARKRRVDRVAFGSGYALIALDPTRAYIVYSLSAAYVPFHLLPRLPPAWRTLPHENAIRSVVERTVSGSRLGTRRKIVFGEKYSASHSYTSDGQGLDHY